MDTPNGGWENLFLDSGLPDRIMLVGFKADSLKQYTSQSLGEVARLRGTSPEETATDLVIQGRQSRPYGVLPHERGHRAPAARTAEGELRL